MVGDFYVNSRPFILLECFMAKKTHISLVKNIYNDSLFFDHFINIKSLMKPISSNFL